MSIIRKTSSEAKSHPQFTGTYKLHLKFLLFSPRQLIAFAQACPERSRTGPRKTLKYLILRSNGVVDSQEDHKKGGNFEVFIRFEYEFSSKYMQSTLHLIISGEVSDPIFGMTLFRDLTEILVLRSMAMVGEQGEMEDNDVFARRLYQNWHGYPHKRITGKPLQLKEIQENFAYNMFKDLTGSQLYARISQDLKFPRNTKIILNKDKGSTSSSYIISNDFLTITIAIYESVIGQHIRLAHPDESALKVQSLLEKEMGPFRRVDTTIYFDVKYKKLRRGFPEMKYYVQWADDLYSLLERRFTWGQPPLVSYREFERRQYKKHKAN